MLTALAAAAVFEFGLGGTATYLEDYVGAGQGRYYLLPFPYIYYHSDKLSIDRNIIRGKLAAKGRWRLDLSLSGQVPVNSDKNDARHGMDDLGWLGMAGPALQYYIKGDADSDQSLYLEWPLRAAVSLDHGRSHGRGLESELQLVWRQAYQRGDWTIKPQLSLGARWGSRQLHQYLYGVEEQDAQLGRPAYQAGAGYAGWRLSASFTVRRQQWWLGFFSRYYRIDGASFEDSPLVKSHSSLYAGVALARIF
ncbi:MipA/OmpV family protein [Gallaecimonas kandeliae]|uniref:MipA/OmpV family protein n=1 Tax=Gallaecimonas kandeliae TaxID=3029055 RepID=UPI002647B7AE|nr:MipA/OmpV family protein [Gallaecimonas kandeliae]WKE65820.1 MipA/OmpV family protein [Gallaecimonas kandeliae]